MGEQMQGAIMQEVQQLVQEVVDIAMEQHQNDQGAHEAMGVENKITDATVQTLQRVKRVYDRKIQEMQPTDARGESTEAGQGQGSAPVTVVTGDVEMPRVQSIKFMRDNDGITEAVPVYDESDNEVEDED